MTAKTTNSQGPGGYRLKEPTVLTKGFRIRVIKWIWNCFSDLKSKIFLKVQMVYVMGKLHRRLTRLTRRAGLRRRLAKNGLTLRGKNGTFSEKSDKKESKNGVRLDQSPYGNFAVFSWISWIPKNPRWNARSGKTGWGRRICPPQKSQKIRDDGQTDTSSWKYRVAEKEAPSAQQWSRVEQQQRW